MAVNVVPGLVKSTPPADDSPGPLDHGTPREAKGRSWVGRLLRSRRSKESAEAAVEADPLLAFASEGEAEVLAGSETAAGPRPVAPARRRLWPILAALVIAIGAGGYGLTSTAVGVSWLNSLPRLRGGPQPAKLTLTTRPEGAQVIIDGEPRGVTPLTVSVAAGDHTIVVRAGGHERVLPLTAAAGADIMRDLEMAAPAPAVATGVLSVLTEPPGAQVSVDGQPAGLSPVKMEGVSVGEHTITVAGATGSAERRVSVAAAQAATVVFSLPKVSGPVGGWLSVVVPFEVQVLERDEVIGTSGTSRIMLAAGRHDIVLVNQGLEYQDARRIDVVAGQTTTVRIDPPKVSLNVNARPWAEVAIDGRDLGQTPISNALVTVGTHQLVFRHPQFGERRQTVVVSGRGPQRVSIDLTK